MQKSNRIAVPRGSDGLAQIGRTLYDLRGIRFEDGEGGNAPADETPPAESETHDESICAAKISDLEAQVATLTADNATLVAEHEAEMTKQKAANYDLLQQIPGETDATDAVDAAVDSDVDIDDLFESKD